MIQWLLLIAALYMAWNIGANDLANSMGDVVGCHVLNMRQVIVLAGISNLAGAVLFGSRVTTTVGGGIVPLQGLSPHMIAMGATAAMLAAGCWITIATYLHMPVSTSHSIVGAMLGFGLGTVIHHQISIQSIHWVVLLKIMASWLLSPLGGMVLAWCIFMIIKRTVIARAKDIPRLERIFGKLMVGTSCYIAFAHGSNDVANAVGPLSMVIGSRVSPIVLAIGGVGIVFGLATWGYKVIDTIGRRITELTPTRGFSADLATATTVLSCSAFGLPVSTTHTIVGAIIGVGLAGGLPAVNLNIIKQIVCSWLITVPVAAALSLGLYLGLMMI